jgi:hypothetical protein
MLEVSGLSKPISLKGIKELHSRRALDGDGSGIRWGEGERKPVKEHDPEVNGLLEQIMEESTVGDPMSPLKWSSKSSYQIQPYLESKGYHISEDTIERRLRSRRTLFASGRTALVVGSVPHRDRKPAPYPAGVASGWQPSLLHCNAFSLLACVLSVYLNGRTPSRFPAEAGQPYEEPRQLFVCADGGGSNGNRNGV